MITADLEQRTIDALKLGADPVAQLLFDWLIASLRGVPPMLIGRCAESELELLRLELVGAEAEAESWRKEVQRLLESARTEEPEATAQLIRAPDDMERLQITNVTIAALQEERSRLGLRLDVIATALSCEPADIEDAAKRMARELEVLQADLQTLKLDKAGAWAAQSESLSTAHERIKQLEAELSALRRERNRRSEAKAPEPLPESTEAPPAGDHRMMPSPQQCQLAVRLFAEGLKQIEVAAKAEMSVMDANNLLGQRQVEIKKCAGLAEPERSIYLLDLLRVFGQREQLATQAGAARAS